MEIEGRPDDRGQVIAFAPAQRGEWHRRVGFGVGVPPRSFSRPGRCGCGHRERREALRSAREDTAAQVGSKPPISETTLTLLTIVTILTGFSLALVFDFLPGIVLNRKPADPRCLDLGR